MFSIMGDRNDARDAEELETTLPVLEKLAPDLAEIVKWRARGLRNEPRTAMEAALFSYGNKR